MYQFDLYIWAADKTGFVQNGCIDRCFLDELQLTGINILNCPAMTLETAQFGQAGVQRVLTAFKTKADRAFAGALTFGAAAGRFAAPGANAAAGPGGLFLP